MIFKFPIDTGLSFAKRGGGCYEAVFRGFNPDSDPHFMPDGEHASSDASPQRGSKRRPASAGSGDVVDQVPISSARPNADDVVRASLEWLNLSREALQQSRCAQKHPKAREQTHDALEWIGANSPTP